MRRRLTLLGFIASGAIVASAFATAVPANAAPMATLTASSHSLVAPGPDTMSPDSTGKIECSGDVCIQRTTAIVNNKATVKAWANTFSFVGHFELLGPDGHIANSSTANWVASGAGANFKGVAAGGGYTVIAWDGDKNIGEVHFSV